MKYGIYAAYWLNEWNAPCEPYIDKAAALGFDILEISCAALEGRYATDAALAALRDYAACKGVTLTAGYGPRPEENLGSADARTARHALSFFKETLRKLEAAGIRFLGGGLYSYWPVDYSKPFDKAGEWKRAAANMREIARAAGDRGITLGMEALNRFEGYLINTCAEALAFAGEVGSPNVKVMLDTFHMNIEEDSIAGAIREAGDALGHLHIGEGNRKVPGQGSLPWPEIGRALRDIGYDGSVVMEPFVLKGGGVGADIKIWRDMREDCSGAALDRDAKEALGFVKNAFGGAPREKAPLRGARGIGAERA